MLQQPAKLELNISDPILNIRTKQPKINLSTEPAVVEIRRIDGKMEIDQYPSRYSIGYKNMADFSRDNAQDAMQIILETIGNIAAEGDRLARIESKENAIANISSERSIQEPLDIVWARTNSPKIHFQPGRVEFNPIRGKLNLTLDRGTVDLDLQRGEVRGQITQYQNVRFWTTPNTVDMMT